MHTKILLLAILPLSLSAQATQPDLPVVFVYDADGRPMPGAYATPIAAQAWLGTNKAPAWTVEMHFTVSKDYPYSGHDIGTHKSWPLPPTGLEDRRMEHLQFRIPGCWCIDQYLLVIQAEDTMRIDMPNDPTVRGHLVHRMVARSGAVSSPEVVRFRPVRSSFAALANDERFSGLELRLAGRMVTDRSKRTHRISGERRTH